MGGEIVLDPKKIKEVSLDPTKIQSAEETPEELQGAEALNIPEDKPWYEDTYNFLMDTAKGAGKQLVNEASDIESDLRHVAFPNSPESYSIPKQELGYSWPEQFGSNFARFAQYALPVRAENALAEGSLGLLKNAYRPMRAVMSPAMARFVVNAGDVGMKSAIGAAMGAGTGYVVDQDPKGGALVGGIVPGGAAILNKTGITPAIAEWTRDRSRSALARAIQPGSWYDKWAAKNVLDPILEKGKTFFSVKGLKNMARDEVAGAAERQKAVEPGADALMDWDEVLQSLRNQEDKAFRKGRAGATLQGGQFNPGSIPMSEGKESTDAVNELEKWINDYLEPKTVVDSATGKKFIPFSELNKSKRFIQDIAAEKNAYLGAPEEAMAARTKAYTEGSHAIRPKLEEFAGPEWAKENEIMATWLDVLDLARKTEGKQLGKSVPLAERPLIGFGAHFGGKAIMDKGIVIRALRYLSDSPGWNSVVAKNLYKTADLISNSTGYAPAQIVNWLANIKGSPENSVISDTEPQTLQPGTTVTVPNQDEEFIWTGPGRPLQRKGQ